MNSLSTQYRSNPKWDRTTAEKDAFTAGFTAARKLCAVMGRIAQLEGKDAQEEILKVGTEEAKTTMSLVDALPGVMINTLDP